jgi:hypothetical protein
MFFQKRRTDANVGELVTHLTNLVHFWAYAPPASLLRANDALDSQQERSMATQTAGWLAKETSRLSLHPAPLSGSSASTAQGMAVAFAAGGADTAKRDEFSQTAVGVGEWLPEGGRLFASSEAPVAMSRRAMKRMEREQRKMLSGSAPSAHLPAVATPAPTSSTAAGFAAESFSADGPVIVEAAVVVGPQQWQQQNTDLLYQQKQLSQQLSIRQQFQQQQEHDPERDQAALALERFFKSAGHQQVQQRLWGQDASSSVPANALRASIATPTPAPILQSPAVPPAYTRMQPPPLPVSQDAQDLWRGGSGVWGGLPDLGSAGSAGSGKGGMMFVGDKQVESRSPASDAPWMGFGSAAGSCSVLTSCSMRSIDTVSSGFDGFLGDFVGAAGGIEVGTGAFESRAAQVESAGRFQVRSLSEQE